MPCRRCSECEGMTHHWLPDCDDAVPPTYTAVCKHCEAVGDECPVCADNEDDLEEDDLEEDEEELEAAELCRCCHGAGIVYLRDIPLCAWCDERVFTPAGARRFQATIDMELYTFCSEACRRARVFGEDNP